MLTAVLIGVVAFVLAVVAPIGVAVGSRYGGWGCFVYLLIVMVLMVGAFQALDAWIFGG